MHSLPIAGTVGLQLDPSKVRCDFCGLFVQDVVGPPVMHPCKDYVARAIQRGSSMIIEPCICHSQVQVLPDDVLHLHPVHGGWIACGVCTKIIGVGSARGLVRRAYALDHARDTTPSQTFQGYMWTQQGFWLHRIEGRN